MFEGSESVEGEGGSTDSTVASSISACKKVKTKLCLRCLCWGGSGPHSPLCVLLYDHLPTTLCVFLCLCVFEPVCHISSSVYAHWPIY